MTEGLSKQLSSGVKRAFSGIFLSRISGLGRDLAMAYAFGASSTVAAFMIAFRFSNLLRRFFGEGPLQTAFIPHFEELRLKDPEKAYALFKQVSFFLFVILLGVTLVLEAAFGITTFSGVMSKNNQEILFLTAWLLPCLIFICLYGLNVSLLQCHNAFFVPGVAPALSNIVWIIGALYLKNLIPEDAMKALVKWVFLGFVLQWLATMPLTLKYTKRSGTKNLKRQLYRPGKEVKKLAKFFSLGALGVGAMQINACVDPLFARISDLTGPVYLWYAIRFYQLALAIFGIGVTSTLIPVLSRAIKEGKKEKAQEIFSFGCRRILTLMIPCTFAIFACGTGAIDTVFGRGSFSQDAVLKTSLCLFAYGAGLLPAVAVLYQSAVLYAEGNFRTSTLYAIIAVGVNIALNIFFTFTLSLGPVSTALATSLSTWCNFFILRRSLRKRGWTSQISFQSTLKILFSAAFSAGLALCVKGLFSLKGANLLLQGCVFICALFAFTFILQSQDLKNLFREYLTPGKERDLPTQS